MARLSKVTKELNVGLQTCVDFLQKKGYTVENSLNAKISDEQYELLVMQFSTDKDLRLKAEKAQRERQESKKEAKPTISVEETQKEEPTLEKEEEKLYTEAVGIANELHARRIVAAEELKIKICESIPSRRKKSSVCWEKIPILLKKLKKNWDYPHRLKTTKRAEKRSSFPSDIINEEGGRV